MTTSNTILDTSKCDAEIPTIDSPVLVYECDFCVQHVRHLFHIILTYRQDQFYVTFSTPKICNILISLDYNQLLQLNSYVQEHRSHRVTVTHCNKIATHLQIYYD